MQYVATRVRGRAGRAALAAITAAGVMAALLMPTGASAQAPSVDIVDFEFSPASTTVEVGTTVTWTNSGQAPHTATADGGAWDSGTLNTGDTFSFTPTQAGTFSYICTIHPFMTATLVVTEPAGGQPASPPPSSESPGGSGGPAGGATGGPATGQQPSALPSTGTGSTVADDSGAGFTAMALGIAGAAAIVAGGGLALRARRSR